MLQNVFWFILENTRHEKASEENKEWKQSLWIVQPSTTQAGELNIAWNEWKLVCTKVGLCPYYCLVETDSVSSFVGHLALFLPAVEEGAELL